MNPMQDRTWMMRYPDRSFSRPMSEQELYDRFQAGELSPQDEICPALGYWFSLSDVEEMRKHFGDLPLDRIFKKSSDVTQEHAINTGKIFVDRTKLIQSPDPSPVKPSVPRPIHHHSVKYTEQSSDSSPSGWIKIILVMITLMILGMIYFWFF